jgi:2-amino-4-hydroxy-6-hydroxymethyldihydropteridine diphosphokinase
VNAAARLQTDMAPDELLVRLHKIEHRFGRERRERNEARPLDLDLLDYDGLVRDAPTLRLPHPRLHERAFVLKPLIDVAPDWRHPLLGRTAAELLAALPEEAQQGTRRLDRASAAR